MWPHREAPGGSEGLLKDTKSRGSMEGHQQQKQGDENREDHGKNTKVQ